MVDYELDNYDRTFISDDMICLKCENVLRDPRMLRYCGHHYCQSCAVDHFSTETVCVHESCQANGIEISNLGEEMIRASDEIEHKIRMRTFIKILMIRQNALENLVQLSYQRKYNFKFWIEIIICVLLFANMPALYYFCYKIVQREDYYIKQTKNLNLKLDIQGEKCKNQTLIMVHNIKQQLEDSLKEEFDVKLDIQGEKYTNQTLIMVHNIKQQLEDSLKEEFNVKLHKEVLDRKAFEAETRNWLKKQFIQLRNELIGYLNKKIEVSKHETMSSINKNKEELNNETFDKKHLMNILTSIGSSLFFTLLKVN
jgi:hypothetical protein